MWCIPNTFAHLSGFEERREIARKEGGNSVHEVDVGGRIAILKRISTRNCEAVADSELVTLRYDSAQQAFREIIALRRIDSVAFAARNLFPQLLDCKRNDNWLYILEEKASEGTLEQFLSNTCGNGPVDEFDCLEKSTMPRNMQLSFSVRMLLAVHAMKTVLNICHNDIFGNILVSACENAYEWYFLPDRRIRIPTHGFRPILADFGRYCPHDSNPADVYELSRTGSPLFFDDFESMMFVIRGGELPVPTANRVDGLTVQLEIVARYRLLAEKKIFWSLFGA